jgi:hypothetical protein
MSSATDSDRRRDDGQRLSFNRLPVIYFVTYVLKESLGLVGGVSLEMVVGAT